MGDLSPMCKIFIERPVKYSRLKKQEFGKYEKDKPFSWNCGKCTTSNCGKCYKLSKGYIYHA